MKTDNTKTLQNALKMIEDMKCCGSCEHYEVSGSTDSFGYFTGLEYDCDKGEDTNGHSYCCRDNWKFGGLTKEERMK